VAFDLPTLMGYDSDHSLAEGEVGKCGVAISSLADMEALFDQIPLGGVSTSMTINSPAAILWAMYLAVAEKQGVDWSSVSGTLQTTFEEYIAQRIHLPPSLDAPRVDTLVRRTAHAEIQHDFNQRLPHSRAGSTAIQELAFHAARRNRIRGMGLRRGLDVDDFAAAPFILLHAHNDFFEEIAKYRAAAPRLAQNDDRAVRREVAAILGAAIHAQTAGCSLTAQQPYNNVVRTALQALAAVMGGTQSLHTNSLDEAWALRPNLPQPSRCARSKSSRTKPAWPTRRTRLGVSYFVEALTNEVERVLGLPYTRSTRLAA